MRGRSWWSGSWRYEPAGVWKASILAQNRSRQRAIFDDVLSSRIRPARKSGVRCRVHAPYPEAGQCRRVTDKQFLARGPQGKSNGGLVCVGQKHPPDIHPPRSRIVCLHENAAQFIARYALSDAIWTDNLYLRGGNGHSIVRFGQQDSTLGRTLKPHPPIPQAITAYQKRQLPLEARPSRSCGGVCANIPLCWRPRLDSNQRPTD